MRLQLSSLAAVIAIVVSTTAGAQDITKKPVTGADRKKAAAPATSTPPATDEAPAKSAEPTSATPSMVTSPTVAQPATTTPPPATAAPDEAAPPSTAAPGQTGTTPGQAQTSPGEASEITPAQTGTTPSGQPVPSDQAQATGQVTAATAADVKAGVAVFDQKGGEVGKVESVSAKGAVVSTGKARAEVPVSSLGKNDKGLVISMTRAELEAASAKSTPPKKK